MPPKKSKGPKASDTSAGGVTAEALTRWKNVRGRRGGLKSMINMPMDVIQEICLYLHPRDLLTLSRTTKSFHAFLMQRSSAYLWKDALKKLDGLPPCPEGWIEPAWVSLVFSPYCTACGEGKAATVAWEFLARFCASCRDKMVVAENKLRLTNEQWRQFGMISKEAFIKAPVTGFKRHCYMWSQILEVLEAYGTLDKSGKSKEASDCAIKYVQQARRSQEYAALCRKWVDDEERLRTKEVVSVIRERFKGIVSRLRELGWGPELDFVKARDYTPLSQHKLVLVAKKLTDRVWLNIQSELIHCMEGIREERLEHENTPMLTERWSILESAGKEILDRHLAKHPEMLDYGLNIADLALTTEFREIMCAPADQVVDRTSFLALEEQIDVIIEDWRTRVCEEFRKPFVEGKIKVKAPRGVDPLDLATTAFAIYKPHKSPSAFFPNIVASSGVRSATREEGRNMYERFIYGRKDIHCYVPPTPDLCLMRDCNAPEIIRSCGLDPDTATAKDMDALDARWVRNVTRTIVTWRTAVLWGGSVWHLADARDIARAKEREGAILPIAKDAVEEHLRAEHGVEHVIVADIETSS
ncbi:uncharacterized protein B0H18DRAFT_1210527 [Fomitopsis serialis]|uniref:uncharacterized protein n=1 Tax=Fomitopsis serialis TaxID=139415 RepID=UPI00200743D2|nr:uncharacterized protein B0H18DRAFT_1210527 [Neoantrodia serialis]KAH9927807.1 hypothetical protein B0H18DRAFT_1210527 [Neoantrodia serialis]